MSVAALSIREATLTWSLCFAVLACGWLAYAHLLRLDDPQLAVREARVITPYPGASAADVEREVSDKIEKAARTVAQLGLVESYSSRGLSVVNVHTQGRYGEQDLPQVWDELRKKVDDAQPQLPPGSGPSQVDDQLGDVYGAYYALIGEGFTPSELKRVAKLLHLELMALNGVAKAILFGEQQETLYVEVSTAKAKALGIGLEQVVEALGSEDLPTEAGRIRIGPELVSIRPSEVYRSEQDLGELMIAPGPDRLVRLGDLAEVRRSYQDPPPRLLRIDGRPAVGIAVAAKPGVDPIAMGEALKQRLSKLTAEIPLGMELKTISLLGDEVAKTVDAFTGYLIQAAVILVAALLLFMGLRGGLVVAFLTVLTLSATFVVMDRLQMSLDRISIGTLVIALGLIPGNAILVVEGIKVRLDQGMAGVEAARKLMAEKAVPLLGATAVTVLAFAPMEGMGNGTGDYTRPLFLVILIALPLSWVSALTLAPLLADRFLKSNGEGYTSGDSFDHGFLRLYARTLDAAIRHRWSLLGATALLSTLSIYGFGFVQQIYFLPSNSTSLLVEVYFRSGTHIRETERAADEIQAYLHSQEGILQVATAIGARHPGYLPGYRPEPDPGSNYAASLTSVDDPRRIDAMGPRIQAGLEARFPDAVVNVERQARAMDSAGGPIQLRIGGPDPVELRHLADRAKAVIAADPDAKAVRDDWGAKVKVARPVLDGELARRLHIDRAQIASALRTAYSGSPTGFYPAGSELVPIVVRAPKDERSEVEDMGDIQVTSPLRGDRISLDHLVQRLDTVTEDSRRSRRDGMAVITVHADADRGSAFELLARIKPQAEQVLGIDSAANESADPRSTLDLFERIKQQVEEVLGIDSAANESADPRTTFEIPLKGSPGYFIAWGGEAESLAESRAGLWTWLPYCFGLIVLALIALFNGLRQPLIVLLTAPLSLIGAAAGLLLTGRPFDFMSLLGLLGLSGILMRNATLLVSGIDLEIQTNPRRPSAVREAATKHLRPLALAAGTSALTLLPLLQDGLFRSMAVTLLFGLVIAIMLALVLVPVLYSVLFPIRSGESP